MRTSLGDMRDRLRFESRASVDDGYGNLVAGDWTEQFTRAATIRQMKGGDEAVIAARLQGRVPVRIVVSSDSGTRQITHEWRAVDTRSSVVYAIKTVYDEERRGQFITIDAVIGEAE